MSAEDQGRPLALEMVQQTQLEKENEKIGKD